MQTLWIVSEQSPGHDSQSRGLGEALAKRLQLTTVSVVGRMATRGWRRPLIKRRMGQEGRPLPQAWLDKYFHIEIPADAPRPDLVISSGGKSVFCARTFAQQHGATFIYLGEQNRFPDNWFDLIVSPIANDPRPNAITCEIVPTPVTPESVQAAAAKLERPPGRLWTVVIGGRSRGQHFEKADWLALASGINTLAARHGIRWLLTTSRRTGAATEAILRQQLKPEHLADAIWWAEAPRRQLHAFLHWGEFAFITQDSVTMISEAIGAARPVVAVPARKYRIPESSFQAGMYRNLIAARRIVKVPPTELAGFDPDAQAFTVLDRPVLDGLVHEVLDRLANIRPVKS